MLDMQLAYVIIKIVTTVFPNRYAISGAGMGP